MGKKKDLEKQIENKMMQLLKAERNSNVLNAGRTKSSSQAVASRILVDSLHRELRKLQDKLESLKESEE